MAKRQVSIQDTVENEEDFQNYLQEHFEQVICLEVYCEFCGPCLATGNAIRKGKLEIGMDDIAMVKANVDKIDSLARFRGKSEPTFLFIRRGKVLTLMYGANAIDLCNIITEEVERKRKEDHGAEVPTVTYEIEEMLPVEIEKEEQGRVIAEQTREQAERLRCLTVAARKRRVAIRLSVHTKRMNFIMFWPHCHKAHYDLYETCDNLNINVAAKDEIQLTEETAKEALYMSDVDMNEACMAALLSGKVLVVLYKMFDTDDRDFIKILRYALYEMIPEPKEDVPPEKQIPPFPAFERYATISKTPREVRRERYEAKLQRQREEEEERQRLEREQERIRKQEEQDRIDAENRRKEEERMARLAAGLPASPEPEEAEPVAEGEELEGEEAAAVEGEHVEEETPEAVAPEAVAPEAVGEEAEKEPEKEASFHSDVEIEDEEYIPPGGLFVPGLYCPPNEMAKANGLKLFYPKKVAQLTNLESEFLPPHVLVMFNVDKRQEVQDIVNTYADEILALGFFLGDDPFKMEHVAYTLKHYDGMIRPRKHLDRLALMVSRKRSLPLLQLAGLNPVYISSDLEAGERDCLTLFPVGYGDDYVEEEDVVEEAVPEVQVAEPVIEQPVEAVQEKVAEEEDEEELT